MSNDEIEVQRQRTADELEAEVERRHEYYGLDNWGFREVVDFVLDHYTRGIVVANAAERQSAR